MENEMIPSLLQPNGEICGFLIIVVPVIAHSFNTCPDTYNSYPKSDAKKSERGEFLGKTKASET
jgi:hypothetical protein